MTDQSFPAHSLTSGVFARSPAPLAVARSHGTLAAVNPAWAAMLGRDAAELTGVGLAELAVPEDRAAVAEELDRLAGAAQDAEGGGEQRFGGRDGAAPRLLRWRAARAGDLLHLSAQDVTTERAATEAALAELDALAASVSHDLRAPLRAIDGFAQILLADAAALPDDTRRFLGLVRDAGAELAGLFDDLLMVTRTAREPLDLHDGVDPAHLATELVDAVLRPRQGDREVIWVIGDVPPCRADPRLLRRLLEALLGNALKFTAPHDRARIELGWDPDAAAYLVRDDGVGFDAALAPTAFGIFGRLHGRDAFPGSGVGLAVAVRVAARHGGRLWAASAPGEGATFRFTLAPETAGGR